MMFVTAIQWQWSDQLAYGYFVTSRNKYTDGCANSWWGIMFFVQALIPDTGPCMEVLWYVQADMGIYLFLPFIVWIFYRNKLAGLYTVLAGIFVATVMRFVNAFYFDIGANLSVDQNYEPGNEMQSWYAIGEVLS